MGLGLWILGFESELLKGGYMKDSFGDTWSLDYSSYRGCIGAYHVMVLASGLRVCKAVAVPLLGASLS